MDTGTPVAPPGPAPRGRVLPVLLFLVVAGAAAWYWLPGFRSTVRNQFEKAASWDAEARRSDPVGFISWSIEKLDDNIAKFGDVKGNLAIAKVKLQRMHDDHTGKVAFASKELETFKAAYKDASGGGVEGSRGWPVTVAGKAYGEADLKAQVNLLLTQRASYESVLAQTSKGLAAAEQNERTIVARITDSKAKLDLLRTQRELVKVNQLTEATETILGEVHDVLIENEALTAENPVRTVEELMRQAESATPASNANVDAFLNG